MHRRHEYAATDPRQRHRLLSGGLDEVWVERIKAALMGSYHGAAGWGRDSRSTAGDAGFPVVERKSKRRTYPIDMCGVAALAHFGVSEPCLP